MSDKKHIDRLFQEGFKDFEATPSDAVWENIEANLNEKNKKRRVMPIWWRYAGIAALLLLLLTVGNLLINNPESKTENQIVDTETASEEKNTINASNPLNTENQLENNVTTTNAVKEASDRGSETKLFYQSNINEDTNKSLITDNHTLANKNEAKLIPNNTKLLNNNQQGIAKANGENELILRGHITDGAVVASVVENPSSDNNETLISKTEANKIINNSAKNSIAATAPKENSLDAEKQTNALTIEEAIEENESIIEKGNKTSRWSVTPNAAPVYFNTLGKGSSLDKQFNNNSKTGDVNMSYGLSTSYAINKKLKIRSGINKVNLGYNTNDVIVFQSSGSSSSALKNINSGASNNESDGSVASGEALIPDSFGSSNTSINQSLGYIEIPLEFQYSLSEKRLGVNVIGGFSSFFLNDNSVHSENANGQRIFLGEANNINNTSYSANFGVGLNYKFSKKIDLNLEPTFKYQFNTFNNTTGNFTPYFIGVYTGFAIKF